MTLGLRMEMQQRECADWCAFEKLFREHGFSDWGLLWIRHGYAIRPGLRVYVKLHGENAGMWTVFAAGEVGRGAGADSLAKALA